MTEHTVLLTCAGASTRFPNYSPKWALTHPSGSLMAAESVRGLVGDYRLLVGLRAEDAERYGVENVRREFFLSGVHATPEVIALEPTSCQVETALRMLVAGNVTGSFTIKDCDNAFRLPLRPDSNEVAVQDLHACARITPGNKSYVRVGGNGTVFDVAEKRIISPLFCCGAYSFRSVHAFQEHAPGAAYVSEVVAAMVQEGTRFAAISAIDYEDWGTEEDWAAYRRTFRTVFLDVDGVLFRSAHRSFAPRWGENEPLVRNVEYINRLHETGRVEVVLTTARPESERDATEQQLAAAGVRYDRIVMGLRNCARVVVNDAPLRRGEHTCFAVNVERDADALEQVFRTVAP